MSPPDSQMLLYRLRGLLRGREKTFDLAAGVYQVGSSRSADVVLPVAGVSRRHVLLSVTSSALILEDLGSTNGTWVDGVAADRQSVAIGSEIRLGPVRLQVEAVLEEEVEIAISLDSGQPEDITPVSTFTRDTFTRDESTLALGHEDGPQAQRLFEGMGLVFPPGFLAGSSRPMIELYSQMRPLLRGSHSVLITGETGVGKELITRILHDSSDRRYGPFVALNCAAIPADLMEAELFGIGKGVATGVEPRQGRFDQAAGGTLFLDEVGEMAMPLQAKLLRVLQEKEVQPLGGAPRKIDVRVLAATNVDLPHQVEAGRLRPDLFYRLAGSMLEVPALRRRRQDLPALIEHFLKRFRDEAGIRVRGLSVAALRVLTDYSWPGNIRELEHEIRRLVYACSHAEVISSDKLSAHLRRPGQPEDGTDRWIASLDSLALAPAVQAVEESLIREALRRAKGKKVEACRLLGLSRNGLDKKLKRFGIGPVKKTGSPAKKST